MLLVLEGSLLKGELFASVHMKEIPVHVILLLSFEKLVFAGVFRDFVGC